MKTRIFFLEGDLDIANSFLNSLIFLLSSFLHSKRYMIIFSLWDFIKFKNLDSFGANFKLDAVTHPFNYDLFQSLR